MAEISCGAPFRICYKWAHEEEGTQGAGGNSRYLTMNEIPFNEVESGEDPDLPRRLTRYLNGANTGGSGKSRESTPVTHNLVVLIESQRSQPAQPPRVRSSLQQARQEEHPGAEELQEKKRGTTSRQPTSGRSTSTGEGRRAGIVDPPGQGTPRSLTLRVEPQPSGISAGIPNKSFQNFFFFNLNVCLTMKD